MVKHIGQDGGEPEWIKRIAKRVSLPRDGQIALGIGDDCAIFRPRGATEDLLFTTDMLLEDVHFRRATHTAQDAGWKAIARGLSDIAAMGGTVRFCLLSLALPPWADRKWMDGFYTGFLKLADRAGAILIGGDLARAEKACCDVVVCGAAPRGKALRRDGARDGDAIYVSGALGGSALGLCLGNGRAFRRHLRPEPRLALGRFLRERLHATAAMDLSDGLSLDLRRMCTASKLEADIEAPPIYPGASLEQALHGGEDYELLFTVPPRTRVPENFEDLPLTRVGVMSQGKHGLVRLGGDVLPALGWDHLR